MASLILKKVSKTYPGGVQAVKEFSLEINENEFIVLLGPSGCGKSTLLRMITGLEEITSGEIYLGDKRINNLAPSDRNLALVFQNYALYSHMSAYENIGFSLQIQRQKDTVIHTKVMETQKKINLTNDELKRKPEALSGGQRQRVALGRAITKDTKLFLMDEPLSNLDAKLRGIVRQEIIALFNQLNKTIIYVTHDQLEAMTMASRIVIMDDGIIQQVGSPLELYNQPANLFVARFLGETQINTVFGNIDKGTFNDGHQIEKNLEELNYVFDEKDFAAYIAIRAENLEIVASHGDFQAEIDFVEFLGSTQTIYVKYNEQILRVKTSSDNDYSVGQKINLKMKPDKLLVYDGTTENLIKRTKL